MGVLSGGGAAAAAAAAAEAAHRLQDELSQSKSGLCSGAVLISPLTALLLEVIQTLKCEELSPPIKSPSRAARLHAPSLPDCVRVSVCAGLAHARLRPDSEEVGGGGSSCRNLPWDTGNRGWRHRGDSREASHGALITRAPRPSRVFTAYPARKSLGSRTEVGAGAGDGAGYGGSRSPLKRLPAEVAWLRRLPTGRHLEGMCLEFFAGKSLSEPQPSQMKGLKLKGASSVHTPPSSAPRRLWGSGRGRSEGRHFQGSQSRERRRRVTRKNSPAALRQQPPAPAVKGSQQENILRKVTFLPP